jgi:signal transduction histidine kinase
VIRELLDPAHWRANPVALLPLVTFVTCVTMGLLFWTNRKRTRRRGVGFTGISITSGFWASGVALTMCLDWDGAFAWVLAKLIISMLLVTGPFGLQFGFDFARVKRPRLWLGIVSALTAGSIAAVWLDPLVVVAVREPPWGGRYPVGGPHLVPAVSTLVVAILVLVVICGREWWRLPRSRKKRQMAYLTLAFSVAVTGGIDTFGALGVDVLPLPLGWLTSLLANVVVYYAVARWRLVDIRTAVHRTAFALVEAAAVFAPLYLLARATAGWGGWSEPLARAVAVTGTVVLLRLYSVRTTAALEAFFDRRRRERAVDLDAFTGQVASAARKEDLVAPLAEALRRAGLELEGVAIAVDVGEGTPAVYEVLPAGAPAAPFESGGPLPSEAITRAELDPEAQGPDAFELGPMEAQLLAADRVAARWLDAYGADVLVPLRHGGVQIGALLARAASREVTLDEAARAHLGRIAARGSVAFTNACLTEDLDRRSATLEQAVEERTSALARAIDELKARQAALVQAEKQSSLGLLVAGVSHEINNALNFIYGNLPTLEKYARVYDDLLARARAAGAVLVADTETRVEAARQGLGTALAAVAEAARRARQIVDDLRRFARHDEAERKAADVREGLDSTLNLLRDVLGERVRVERRYADVPPVECFPAALNHVFLNVLVNAAQAIDGDGQVTIDVAADPDAILVRVSDTGQGVPAGERERVFEAFHSTRGAAGLGLTVSRQIVERHGGTISLASVDDRDGGGAAVTIRIPTRVVA